MTGNEAFLGGIIDYAGLFPPAQLSLEQALRTYVRELTGPDAWLLGRFVCPAARLEELAALCKDVVADIPAPIAVLGRGGKDTQDYFASVKNDMADSAHFSTAAAGRGVVHSYEVRLPASAFNPLRANQLSSLVATTAYLIETTGPTLTSGPFFEAPLTDRASLLAVIQALHDDHHSAEARSRRRVRPVGFKLRTGGLEPAAFPTSEQVALVLAACSAADVPFKATAGLHHPLRHLSTEVNVTMHGFVNVFAAGCLAQAKRLDEARIRALVEEEDATQFHLDAAGLRWRELTVTAQEIAQGRQLFTSFGSCSFDEPREDLRRLHWLA